jgi:hypothetical protein
MALNQKQLNRDLKIDEYNLQNEWTKQPTLFMDYAVHASNYRLKRDDAKRKLSNKILKEKEGEKFSEAALNRLVDRDPEILELRNQRDLFKYAAQALEMKKKALEHLQQLLIGGFFAEPKEKPLKKKRKK